jgi:hypothetical protein
VCVCVCVLRGGRNTGTILSGQALQQVCRFAIKIFERTIDDLKLLLNVTTIQNGGSLGFHGNWQCLVFGGLVDFGKWDAILDGHASVYPLLQ